MCFNTKWQLAWNQWGTGGYKRQWCHLDELSVIDVSGIHCDECPQPLTFKIEMWINTYRLGFESHLPHLAPCRADPMTDSSSHQSHEDESTPGDEKKFCNFVHFKSRHLFSWCSKILTVWSRYLRTDLSGLLGIDRADVLVMLQCVLPVLLLCTDVFLQQAQNLTGLMVAQGYVISGVITRWIHFLNMCVLLINNLREPVWH